MKHNEYEATTLATQASQHTRSIHPSDFISFRFSSGACGSGGGLRDRGPGARPERLEQRAEIAGLEGRAALGDAPALELADCAHAGSTSE